MTYTMHEYCNTFNTDYKTKLLNTFTVSGKDDIAVFRDAYPHERSLRYCNGYWVEFEDKEMQKKFLEWKANGGVDINLFYGGVVYD